MRERGPLQARCASFPLDELLHARRKRRQVCVACFDREQPEHAARCSVCGEPALMPAESAIIESLRRVA